MKKIIAFTGSFNPVTVAHYKILSDAVEKYQADEGVFIATNNQYLTKKSLTKVKQPTNFILSEEMRGEMLSSLTEENSKLKFCGFELGGVSANTYKTLVKLYEDKKKQYFGEEIQLYFLLGADKLKNLAHWQNIEKMVDLCEFLVYARHFDLKTVIEKDPFLSAHKDIIHLMQVESEDLESVSSTEVRRRFFAGEDYRALMNEGPYRILQQIKPEDFPPVSDEDIIKAHLKYGGRFGANTARLQVYNTNCKLFSQWQAPWLGNREEHRLAKTYGKFFTVSAPTQPKATVTDCVNADCVDVAKAMLEEGLHPAILNLASRTSPGGGYHKGTNAQEESLCQMSTLSQSLYAFGDTKYKHIRESFIKNIPGVYPMDLNFDGVYSPCVTFFRHNANHFYILRDEVFNCPVVSVASLSNREKNDYTNDERIYFDESGLLTAKGREIETNKIRTLFRIALENGHDSMVLGAFGCGVYHLDCNEVATLFRDVLEEPEFKNKFTKLVFAIYEGKPTKRKPATGRDGKFAPFYKVFGDA